MKTPTQRKHALPVALAAVMALLLTTACGDRPITDLSQEQDGRPLLKTITATGNFKRPSGTVDLGEILVVDFDTSVPDAFARGTGESYAHLGPDECPYEDGCWVVEVSDFNDAGLDTRENGPTAQETGATDYSSGAWNLLGPDYFFGPFWDWWVEFSGLEPNHTYYAGVARLSVEVNGLPDQAERLLNRTIQPDRVAYEGGTPGGDGNRPADLFTDAPTWPYFAEPNANPWVFGQTTSDGDGVTRVDVLTSSFDSDGNQVYYDGPPFDASADPFVGNDAGLSAGAGEYNYFVVWSENPLEVANAEIAVMIQLGADLQSGGSQTLNNSFAPFPDGVADLSNLPNLPGGANAFAAPGTIDFSGVGFMAGPTFEIGVFSRDDGSFTPVNSQVVITDTLIVDAINGIIDTLSVDTLQGVSSFTSPRGGAAVDIAMDADVAGVDFGANSHVVARLAGVEGSEFLYQEYLTADKALQDGGTSFGSLNGGQNSTTYTLEGQGLGRFFGDSLLVTINRVNPEPPAGFHYQSYLIGTVQGATTMARVHTVDLDALGNGQDRIGQNEVEGTFGTYNFWVLALEPDGVNLTADGVRTLQVQVSEDYYSKFSDLFDR